MRRISQVERLRKVKGGVGSQARRGIRKINEDSHWSEKDWAQLSIAKGAVVTVCMGLLYYAVISRPPFVFTLLL